VTPTEARYGDHPAQFGELSRPVGRPSDTVVIIHGGFWRAAYSLDLGRPLAADLLARGYTVWNLEYRRVGGGGGWPATFEDVAAGVDLLAELDVDTDRVVLVGHSAGGHLAVWAAGRAALAAAAPGAGPRVTPAAVISQAGVLDLAAADRLQLSNGAVRELLGEPSADRLALTDPLTQAPLTVPVRCVHSRRDEIVPFAQSAGYVAAAQAAGGRASLVESSGDHFTLIDPATPDWQLVVSALPELLGG
jgi:acetyl esterase/lipase